MTKFCCNNDERRLAVMKHPVVNGIDFIEVVDDPLDEDQKQTGILIHFLKALPSEEINRPQFFAIQGGVRIKNIRVKSTHFGGFPPIPFSTGATIDDKVLFISLDKPGDFSTYRLQLLKDENSQWPPLNFDPILSSVDFSFHNACQDEFDCKTDKECETRASLPKPEINYLARDYDSFKQLMLDRMAQTIPQWKERNAADIGVMLVELLAYTSDYLSYRQDAIATEAYLETARKRISVKRHARLVDYRMHDGCNARTWIHLKVADGISGIKLKANPNTIKFVTALEDKSTVIRFNSKKSDEILRQRKLQVFEPIEDLELNFEHNYLRFYTWGNTACQLRAGTTQATIDGHITGMEGKYFVLQEIVSPHTFNEEDANPSKRHVVKIVSVNHIYDIIGEPNSDPANPLGRLITEITWDEQDALPFDWCLNTVNPDGQIIETSILTGNIVLADHGNTLSEVLEFSDTNQFILLKSGPLTHSSFKKTPHSATSAIKSKPQEALPQIELYEQSAAAQLWEPVPDLISSYFNNRHFVVDIEEDGKTQLRFGNGKNGRQPAQGMKFGAIYRIGNGRAGNIPTGSMNQIISDDASINKETIIGITNLTPGKGGAEPERIEEVKYKAPIAFRTQERAVTLQDYETKCREADANIQHVTASARWTGSWRTLFLSVDAMNEQVLDQPFINKLQNRLDKYRMAGQDLKIEKPFFVPLEIEIDVCLQSGYARSDIKKELFKKLSSRRLHDGTRGLFHTDNFTFGQPVYLSNIYSAIQKVTGVLSVKIKKFQRLGDNHSSGIDAGELPMGRYEIARLDNDPNALENGILKINMTGGNG